MFFLLGFLFNMIGILVAVIARFVRKREERERYHSIPVTSGSPETPGYYQPVYLQDQIPPEESHSPEEEPPLPQREVPLEGMLRCSACEADNPRDLEFCWRCNESLGSAKEDT